LPISIQPIGKLFQVNDEGFLVNPTDWCHVPAKFHALIEGIKNSYCQFYQNDLHSLYLRGSIVRGTYIENLSDIDAVGLIHLENKKWEHTVFEAAFSKAFKEEFSYSGRLELMISSYSSDLSSTYPTLAMILKTQSLCIWGNDIIESLNSYKPDRSLLFHYKWLERDISIALKDHGDKIIDYQSVMKLMIRSGFELIIEKSGTYTADLYPAVQAFGKYYPAYKEDMEKTLFYFLNPNVNVAEQKRLLLTFGKWLINEVDRKMR
jgi:hypothetical protein